MILFALVVGCAGPKQVSSTQFSEQYRWVGVPQTMRQVVYLGQREGKAFLRLRAINILSGNWSDRIIFVELKELEPEFRDTLPEREFKG
jgi:hypothetical protein